MKKIEFNVYAINELKAYDLEAYHIAIEHLIDRQQDLYLNLYINDYINTLKAIEKLFDVRYSAWDVDGYDCYYRVKDAPGDEISTYKRTYSYVINTIMPKLNNDFDFSLTGFCADYEPLNILQKFIAGSITFTSVTDLIENMCISVLKEFNNEYQYISDLENMENLEDDANVCDIMFFSNGKIYNEDFTKC